MYLKLRVEAGAKENALTRKSPDTFIVRVREPAQNGRANRAALALVGRALGLDPGRLRLIKGAHSSSKIVEVREQSS